MFYWITYIFKLIVLAFTFSAAASSVVFSNPTSDLTCVSRDIKKEPISVYEERFFKKVSVSKKRAKKWFDEQFPTFYDTYQPADMFCIGGVQTLTELSEKKFFGKQISSLFILGNREGKDLFLEQSLRTNTSPFIHGKRNLFMEAFEKYDEADYKSDVDGCWDKYGEGGGGLVYDCQSDLEIPEFYGDTDSELKAPINVEYVTLSGSTYNKIEIRIVDDVTGILKDQTITTLGEPSPAISKFLNMVSLHEIAYNPAYSTSTNSANKYTTISIHDNLDTSSLAVSSLSEALTYFLTRHASQKIFDDLSSIYDGLIKSKNGKIEVIDVDIVYSTLNSGDQDYQRVINKSLCSNYKDTLFPLDQWNHSYQLVLQTFRQLNCAISEDSKSIVDVSDYSLLNISWLETSIADISERHKHEDISTSLSKIALILTLQADSLNEIHRFTGSDYYENKEEKLKAQIEALEEAAKSDLLSDIGGVVNLVGGGVQLFAGMDSFTSFIGSSPLLDGGSFSMKALKKYVLDNKEQSKEFTEDVSKGLSSLEKGIEWVDKRFLTDNSDEIENLKRILEAVEKTKNEMLGEIASKSKIIASQREYTQLAISREFSKTANIKLDVSAQMVRLIGAHLIGAFSTSNPNTFMKSCSLGVKRYSESSVNADPSVIVENCGDAIASADNTRKCLLDSKNPKKMLVGETDSHRLILWRGSDKIGCLKSRIYGAKQLKIQEQKYGQVQKTPKKNGTYTILARAV